VGLRRRPEPEGAARRRRGRRRRGGEDQGGRGHRHEEGERGHVAGVPVDQGQVPAEERRREQQEAAGLRGPRVLTPPVLVTSVLLLGFGTLSVCCFQQTADFPLFFLSVLDGGTNSILRIGSDLGAGCSCRVVSSYLICLLDTELVTSMYIKGYL
jgi:hypothetical protein